MEKTAHLLILTDCFNDVTAGAEKQIFELTKGLQASAYRVFIVSLDECSPSMPPLLASYGATLEVFRVKRIYGLSGLIQGIRFFRFLKNRKIDIVQTFHFGSDIWGTAIAHWAGVKLIISNRRDMGFWRKGLHIKAYQMINRWVHRIIVNAQSIKDMVIKTEGVTPEKIEVIPNGVELSLPASTHLSRDALGLQADDLVLAHVANLKPVKGHAVLLEAVESLLPIYPNLRLLLVGDDQYNGTLQKKVEARGLSGTIQFLGQRKDVGSILAHADIGVLPSLSEGLSNAILEYMAAGKPVVATRVGGNAELVEDGQTGFLVNKEDSLALAEAIGKLLGDPNLRRSFGDKGRQKATEHFSIPEMVRRYEELFERLLPRKIKVLHFISSGGLFGAENVLLNIAQSFNNERYISFVSAIRDARQPNLDVIEKAKSLNIPVHTFESQGMFDFQIIKQLKNYLIENKFDVLHTHNYKSDIVGALAARGTGAALISTAHGFTGMNSKVSLYESLDRWFLKKRFKRTVVVSEQMLPDFPSGQRRIINNGIDFKKFHASSHARREIRERHKIQDTDFLIGTVGRLSVEKDQALLLSALLPIFNEYPYAKAMIIGDGPEGDALKGFVKTSRLEDRVIFTGLVPNPAPYYQAFDIFVLSSRTEGVPLTILEAMASKVPVIATKVGGIPQIVTDGHNGLLVDPGQAAQLGQAIRSLIADQSLRERFKYSAFKYAHENYSLERMNGLYHNVYQEVVSP